MEKRFSEYRLMKKRKRINTIKALEPIESEKELIMITPDTDVTKLPYQGFISSQDYYYRLQASCFEFDNSIKEITQRKLSGSAIRDMTPDEAIEAFKALESAKLARTKQFIELATHLADDSFFRKQQEIERLKALKESSIQDVNIIEEHTVIEEPVSTTDKDTRNSIIRLLQEAIVNKIDEKENDE